MQSGREIEIVTVASARHAKCRRHHATAMAISLRRGPGRERVAFTRVHASTVTLHSNGKETGAQMGKKMCGTLLAWLWGLPMESLGKRGTG